MCKFYVSEKYREKIENILSEKDIFEVNAFMATHEICDYDSLSDPDCVASEDIFAIDEVTFEVFVEHLDCYFKK